MRANALPHHRGIPDTDTRKGIRVPFNKSVLCTILGVGFSGGLGHSALADEVHLKNGDLIKGEIIKKETDKLILKTEYAGEIGIAWSAITSLHSDKALNIVLNDDSSFRAPLTDSVPGKAKVELAQPGGEIEVDLASLKYINPSPAVSGNGVEWHGRANAGGGTTQGNTDTQTFHIDAETVARTKNNRFTLGAVVNRAKSDGIDTQFNSRGYMKYDHFLTKKWYLYANNTLENDRFQDINLRTTVGVGNGYQIFEGADLNLAVEGGLNYVSTDYKVGNDENYPSARWAVKYDQKIFGGNTRIFHEHELLLSLEDMKNNLFFSKTGLRFPLGKGFNASTQYNFDYTQTPTDSRKHSDSALLFNLGYDW